MERAAVLIGVKNTGGLPMLAGVQGGLDKMRQWAMSQPGMTGPDGATRITLVSDANGVSVTAMDVQAAVKKYVDDGAIEQLFVYFAGHGANVRYSEYWLLSGAPENPNEAINIEGSIPLGRQCGIPHVVLISDACRTAAATIQSQAVQGGLMFANRPPIGNPGCVDIFYASQVGNPSLEVKDPQFPAHFEAVYTSGLVSGLGGAAKAEVEDDEGKKVRRVRAWPLKRYLSTAVPDLLSKRVGFAFTQNPDAIITSQPEAWLSELEYREALGRTGPPAATPNIVTRASQGVARGIGAGSPMGAGGGGPTSSAPRTQPRNTRRRPEQVANTLGDVSQRLLREALESVTPSTQAAAKSETRAHRGTRAKPSQVKPPSPKASRAGVRSPKITSAASIDPSNVLFASVLNQIEQEEPAGHFESQCGFKLRGNGVVHALSGNGRIEILGGANGRLVRMWSVAPPATNTLLIFENGRAALLPAIPGWISVLAFEGNDLVNVRYEPSENTALWIAFQQQLGKLARLRRVVAAAARLGVFRPDEINDRQQFVSQLRSLKGLDPTMAVYAAYALHSLQQPETIREMETDLRASVGISLFDVALLARQAGFAASPMLPDVFPAVPLLSQGWALLDTFGVKLPSHLGASLHRSVTNSLWTLFDSGAITSLSSAITSKEVL